MPCEGFPRKGGQYPYVAEIAYLSSGKRYARKIARHDTMSSMNAFWNSFETLLGLGVEPRDLSFVQISLRGVIVFLVTLITMRLVLTLTQHSVRLRTLCHSCRSTCPRH